MSKEVGWGVEFMVKAGEHRDNTGFTIVELFIVIVVIGTLAAITIVSFNGVSARARVAVMQSDLEGSAKILEVARVNLSTDIYPADIASANLKATSGDTYIYQSDNTITPASYCLTVINASVMYKISSTNNTPVAGGCTGMLSNGTLCPSKYIVVPGNSIFGTPEFCVTKYEVKNVGGIAVSQAAGTPWVFTSQPTVMGLASSACSGCHLMTEGEWMTIAANVLGVSSNWSGGAVGSGYIYSGHNDSSPASMLPASSDSDGYSGTGNSSTNGANQRRTLTLSNGEVIWDFAGNAWEWTSDTIAGGQQPGIIGESSYSTKEWNSGSLNMHGLLSVSQPAAISSQAATWSSGQGIGELFSNYGEGSIHGMLRGGSYEDGSLAGVLSLDLFDATGASVYSVGFRVTK